MAKAFDATMKQLLDAFAGDWVRFLAPRLGLPPDVGIDPVDVDLSTVQFAADKVFRLRPPSEGLLHLEPQASHDSALADRLHVYSTLLTDKYELPVYSVALLLRPEANAKHLTGVLERRWVDGATYLRFQYGIVRVWELSCEALLECGWGMAPLALLTDEAKGKLAETIKGMDGRMRSESVPDATRKLVLSCAYLLLGLRYDDLQIQKAFLGVQGMMESSTYRAILREGEAVGWERGRAEAEVSIRRETLLAVLRERFTDVPADLEARINSSTDADALFAAIRRAVHIERIDELPL